MSDDVTLEEIHESVMVFGGLLVVINCLIGAALLYELRGASEAMILTLLALLVVLSSIILSIGFDGYNRRLWKRAGLKYHKFDPGESA